jgi:hypothetical protein
MPIFAQNARSGLNIRRRERRARASVGKQGRLPYSLTRSEFSASLTIGVGPERAVPFGESRR